MVEQEPTLLTATEKQQISEEVLHEVFGLGPLEPLLQDPTISDILVNGYRQVYVERKGVLELTNVRFHDDAHLLRIIDRIVSQVGRRVDESNPMVDARLSDGSRVNAIIPPLAVDGPLLSIRRFGTDKLMPEDLVDRRSLTAGMMRLLEAAVRAQLEHHCLGRNRRRQDHPAERALRLHLAPGAHRHHRGRRRIAAQAAAPGASGNASGQRGRPRRGAPAAIAGQRLRMRPDRIIVGEVRGEEALDMLQAMNTGHDGSLTTVHANTPRDAISRLEVMVSLANANMHLTAIRQQIASAVQILVQCSRLSDGTRRVMSITEVTGMETRHRDPAGHFRVRETGPFAGRQGAWAVSAATGILPKFNEKLVAAGIRLPVDTVRRGGRGGARRDAALFL